MGMWYAAYLSFPPFWHCHISYYEGRNYNCAEVSILFNVLEQLNLEFSAKLSMLNSCYILYRAALGITIKLFLIVIIQILFI